MRVALEILFWVAFAGTVTSTIYGCMVLVGARRFGDRKRREDAVAMEYRPPVSVLKPLHGTEPDLESNLRRFFVLEYPEFELIFCARTEGDTGLQLARQVAAEYPSVVTRFITCGEPQFPNAKMWSMAALGRAARYETLVTSDADARVEPDYLQRCVQVLAGGEVAMASCLYVGRTEGGLVSQLDAVGKSVEMSGGIFVADMLEGTRFALGVTMILERKAFADAGGYEELGQFYAEDFVLGSRLAERGRVVRISNHVIRLMVPPQGWRESFRNQLRWMKSTRRSRPAGHLGTGLTFAMPYAMLGALWAVARGEWMLAVLWLLLGAVNRWVMAAGVLWALADDHPLAPLLLFPLRDLLGGVLWVSSYMGNTMHYHGGAYVLDAGGRFRPAKVKVRVS